MLNIFISLKLLPPRRAMRAARMRHSAHGYACVCHISHYFAMMRCHFADYFRHASASPLPFRPLPFHFRHSFGFFTSFFSPRQPAVFFSFADSHARSFSICPLFHAPNYLHTYAHCRGMPPCHCC